MANYNYSRNNNRGLKVFAVIVTILLVAALVVGLFFIGKTTNGFKEIPTFDDDEVLEDDDLVVTLPEDSDEPGDDEGGSLPGVDDDPGDPDVSGDGAEEIKAVMTLSLIKPCQYEDYGIDPLASVVSAYDVQVVLTPSNADIDTFSWGVELDTTYSGYSSSMITDGNGQNWLAPSAVTVSDYITLSNNDELSCTLTCSQPFGCTMKLVYSVTDKRGNTFDASCKLDYKTYFQSQSITVKNVGNIYSEDLFTMTYTSDVGFNTSASVVPVDMTYLVTDTNYVFTVTKGSVLYTVGTLACEEILPSYSFTMTYDGKYCTDVTSWSSITSTLFGTALGSGNIGDLTHELFDKYSFSNPMVTVTFTSSESKTADIGIYFVNTDILTVPLTDVTMSTEQIIFG